MTIIWTAHIGYRGDDRLDITMKCVPHSLGAAFQPGWDLVMGLKPGKNTKPRITEPQYRALYLQRMWTSYTTNRAYWDALLERPEVTLVCFCAADAFCHRLILAKDILSNPKHFNGVTYEGERR